MSSASLEEDRQFAAMPALDRDAVFAFALFTPMLFIVQFGSYGALLFLIAAFVCAALRHAWLFRMV
ncbi:MAG: hypothetical protein ACREHV_16850, partial [Rhizomicrobium sp.]